MKYNAVKHMIETDAGDPLARLTGDVSAETGFAVADAWSELGQPTADEIDSGPLFDPAEHFARYEEQLAKLEDKRGDLELDVERLQEAMKNADAILANAEFDLRRLCDWVVASGQNPDRDSVFEECQAILNTLGEIKQKLKVG